MLKISISSGVMEAIHDPKICLLYRRDVTTQNGKRRSLAMRLRQVDILLSIFIYFYISIFLYCYILCISILYILLSLQPP